MTKPFLQFDSQEFEIIYREYQDADSENVIALEQEASQVPRLGGLLDGGTIFNSVYDVKCKKFTDHVIIIAEAIDKNNPTIKRICGCACIGIKDIYFNKQKVKAGVLFDLRVSDKFQKRGIGTRLTTLLEETARNKGCQFLYLSVNGDNKKAISLYEKTGYNVISQRIIHRIGITKGSIEDRENTKTINHHGISQEFEFKKLEPEQVKEYYNKFYKNEDLALASFEEISSSSNYLGTYAVMAGNSNIIGGSLFKVAPSHTMGLKKLFFPVHYYAKDWFYSFWLGLLLLISYIIALNVHDSLTERFSSLRRFIGGLVFFLISFLLIMINKKINTFMLQVGNLKSRGRYIGMFYFMKDEELLKPALQFLMERMNKVCSYNHIDNITYNSDKNDKFMEVWKGKPKVRFYTYFMGKFIDKTNGLNDNLKDYKPSQFVFFDPRDI